MRKTFSRLALALAAIAGIAFAGARLPNAPVQSSDEEFVADPQLARLFALGFQALLGDLHWLRAVQVVGSDDGPYGRNGLIGALVDVATTLDPWVGHPYRFAAVWLTDDESAVRKANELLRRGIAHHPDDWRMRFYLAFNHFFYFGESAEAARTLEPALTLEGAPPYLRRLTARLKSDTAGLESAAVFLREMAEQTSDEFERAEYLKALDEVETERRARILDQARAEYVRRHKRDIERVEDLVSGAVLSNLPAEPHGWEWGLSASTGEIVSSYVRHRYRVKIDDRNRQLLDQFRERSRKQRVE